jgi:hypothetical protein
MNLWSPPPGWTADSKELNFDYYWDDPDGDGQMIAKSRQLASPQPLMRLTRDSGELLYMIQSGDNYYIWNQIEESVWKITKPTTIVEITVAIRDNGLISLELEEMPQTADAA